MPTRDEAIAPIGQLSEMGPVVSARHALLYKTPTVEIFRVPGGHLVRLICLELEGRVQAMTKLPYEIPPEIRDLTAKSVEEARKAFENFVEAARKGIR